MSETPVETRSQNSFTFPVSLFFSFFFFPCLGGGEVDSRTILGLGVVGVGSSNSQGAPFFLVVVAIFGEINQFFNGRYHCMALDLNHWRKMRRSAYRHMGWLVASGAPAKPARGTWNGGDAPWLIECIIWIRFTSKFCREQHWQIKQNAPGTGKRSCTWVLGLS